MPDQGRVWGQRLTLVVTNAIKTAGLVVAMKAAFSPDHPPALEFALAAFMMAGAQLSEETIMALVGRMFGSREEPPAEVVPPPELPPSRKGKR